MIWSDTMKPIPEKRTSISVVSDRWAKWQQDTWKTPKEQLSDLDDCQITVDEKTIRSWRKGNLPALHSWALIRAFGWPLLITLFGDVLAETYALEQEDYARRQHENKVMAEALLSLVNRNTDTGGGDSPTA